MIVPISRVGNEICPELRTLRMGTALSLDHCTGGDDPIKTAGFPKIWTLETFDGCPEGTLYVADSGEHDERFGEMQALACTSCIHHHANYVDAISELVEYPHRQ